MHEWYWDRGIVGTCKCNWPHVNSAGLLFVVMEILSNTNIIVLTTNIPMPPSRKSQMSIEDNIFSIILESTCKIELLSYAFNKLRDLLWTLFATYSQEIWNVSIILLVDLKKNYCKLIIHLVVQITFNVPVYGTRKTKNMSSRHDGKMSISQMVVIRIKNGKPLNI